MRYLGVWFLRPWALGSRQSFTSGEKVACEAFQGLSYPVEMGCAQMLPSQTYMALRQNNRHRDTLNMEAFLKELRSHEDGLLI